MSSSFPNLTKNLVGLEAGDSGSIVVDTRDDLIYGLVIGANPIDEIYISPFVEIMHQVQYYFPDSAISLPQPEPSSIAELHRPYQQLPSGMTWFPQFPIAAMNAEHTNPYTQPPPDYHGWTGFAFRPPPTMSGTSLDSASSTYSPSVFSADNVSSAYTRASSEVERSSYLPAPYRRAGEARTGAPPRQMNDAVATRHENVSACVRCSFHHIYVSKWYKHCKWHPVLTIDSATEVAMVAKYAPGATNGACRLRHASQLHFWIL